MFLIDELKKTFYVWKNDNFTLGHALGVYGLLYDFHFSILKKSGEALWLLHEQKKKTIVFQVVPYPPKTASFQNFKITRYEICMVSNSCVMVVNPGRQCELIMEKSAKKFKLGTR